jgi:hypothetical protein
MVGDGAIDPGNGVGRSGETRQGSISFVTYTWLTFPDPDWRFAEVDHDGG